MELKWTECKRWKTMLLFDSRAAFGGFIKAAIVSATVKEI